jgi:hypothetical protein
MDATRAKPSEVSTNLTIRAFPTDFRNETVAAMLPNNGGAALKGSVMLPTGRDVCRSLSAIR